MISTRFARTYSWRQGLSCSYIYKGDREQEQKVKGIITQLAAARNSANVEIKTVFVLSLRLPDTLHLIVV